MTTLTKSAIWYNPFAISYPEVEIGNILFYKDGKIVAETRKGWLENGDNSFRAVSFPFDVKRAIKFSLDRKDAFVIKDKESYDNKYCLYIHTDLIPSFKSLGRVDGNKTWYHTETHEQVEFAVVGVKDNEPEMKTHTIRLNTNYQFTDTEEWIRCKKLCADMKETCGADITEYRMHDILQHYNITKKRK